MLRHWKVTFSLDNMQYAVKPAEIVHFHLPHFVCEATDVTINYNNKDLNSKKQNVDGLSAELYVTPRFQ